MNKVKEEKELKDCITEAFERNAIITSDGLSADEFIFVSNLKAFYEDGACLGGYHETLEFLNSMEWVHRYDWYVIGYLDNSEITRINELRKRMGYHCGQDFKEEILKIIV